MNKGPWYAAGAYATWGLLPAYLKWLQHVPASQLVCHRVLWSCLVLCGTILLSRQWGSFRRAVNAPVAKVYLVAAMLIGINWLLYVWAANSGFIIELSLGYFIGPLISVFLGVLLLHERLRLLQWVAIGFATAGVPVFDPRLWPSALDCFDSGIHLQQLWSGEKDGSARFTLWPDAGDRNTPGARTCLSVVFGRHRPRRIPPRWCDFGYAAYRHRIGNGCSSADVCRGGASHPALAVGCSPVYRADTAIPTWRNGLQRTVYTLPVHRLCQCMGRADHFCD